MVSVFCGGSYVQRGMHRHGGESMELGPCSFVRESREEVRLGSSVKAQNVLEEKMMIRFNIS